ncbi:MAG: 50S ribosomal protein L29 [Acidiferrobacterales bacterium]|jgi:large subunit ribosomal protein L29|nr:50S ribosomal protein L29 [Acidiferrobacterales bacterium]
MKTKDRVKDIRAMDVAGMEKELLELNKEQFNLRMQQSTGQMANTSRMKQVRRDIARVKTIMNQAKGKTA